MGGAVPLLLRGSLPAWEIRPAGEAQARMCAQETLDPRRRFPGEHRWQGKIHCGPAPLEAWQQPILSHGRDAVVYVSVSMATVSLKSYIVFPFHRVGARVGTSRAIVFDEPQKACHFANAVGQQASGVAVLERSVDPETGEETDRLVAKAGAVPPQFPQSSDWTMRLN
jgi:hypothetical protein